MPGARFLEAVAWAAELHASQSRKTSGAPYLEHLLGVASIALRHGADEEEAIAAVLHDAIEDQGGEATRQEILRRFGERVARIVEGCTDTDVQPKPPWKERKEAYVDHVRAADESVVLVSCADKLHNATALLADLRELGADLWSHFRGGREGTLWYYRALVEAYREASGAGRLRRLIDELEDVVDRLEAAARTS